MYLDLGKKYEPASIRYTNLDSYTQHFTNSLPLLCQPEAWLVIDKKLTFCLILLLVQYKSIWLFIHILIVIKDRYLQRQ